MAAAKKAAVRKIAPSALPASGHGVSSLPEGWVLHEEPDGSFYADAPGKSVQGGASVGAVIEGCRQYEAMQAAMASAPAPVVEGPGSTHVEIEA